MKTNISSSAPSQLETDCLVVVVLDHSEKDKPAPAVECDDKAVREAAKDVIACCSSAAAKRRIFQPQNYANWPAPPFAR